MPVVLDPAAYPDDGVAIADGVHRQRASPDGGISETRGVGPEGVKSDGGVVTARGVSAQGVSPDGGVGTARGEIAERAVPEGGITAETAGRDVSPAFGPTNRLVGPVVCANNAPLRERLPVASSTRRRWTAPVLFLIEKPPPASSCTETSAASAGDPTARATPRARAQSRSDLTGNVASGCLLHDPRGARRPQRPSAPRARPSYTLEMAGTEISSGCKVDVDAKRGAPRRLLPPAACPLPSGRGDSGLRLCLERQGLLEAPASERIPRRQLERPPIVLDRLVEAPQIFERAREVQVCRRALRIGEQREPVLLDRLLQRSPTV